MYLSYILGDIGYNLEEWNFVTVLLVLIGWASLVYRIHAEERVISQDTGWPAYLAHVRYRLFPVFGESAVSMPDSLVIARWRLELRPGVDSDI
jgi:protein-S-isoprenylcysteine O-methyltransferase Ste14